MPETTIADSEYFRISVEAPRRGFVYIIARDRGATGYIGNPALIFPRDPSDDNTVAPGKPVSAPAWSKTRSVYYRLKAARSQTYLDLLVIVTPSRLADAARSVLRGPTARRDGTAGSIDVSRLDNEVVDALVDAWSAPSEWLDRTETGDVALTRREIAASVDPAIALTRSDVGPQTIIRLAASPDEPWLAKMELPIID